MSNCTMKTSIARRIYTKSLLIAVVTAATVSSYLSLAMHSRVLPRHGH